MLVRASAAEAREARYRAQGRDCYLFNLDDAHVLDATQAGAISRFTVRPGMGARSQGLGAGGAAAAAAPSDAASWWAVEVLLRCTPHFRPPQLGCLSHYTPPACLPARRTTRAARQCTARS